MSRFEEGSAAATTVASGGTTSALGAGVATSSRWCDDGCGEGGDASWHWPHEDGSVLDRDPDPAGRASWEPDDAFMGAFGIEREQPLASPADTNEVSSASADSALELEGLLAPVKQAAPARAAQAASRRNQPDRDPGFAQVASGSIREGHSPSKVILPQAVADGLDGAWQDSFVDGQPLEQGGNIVRNYDGTYAVRRGDATDRTTFEADYHDVGWTQELVGVMHTHPNVRGEANSFSEPDFTSMLAESQPINLLRSEDTTYMVARTREFDAMAAHYEADERLDELEDEIYDCFDNVYGRTEGTHAEKLEAAVLAVCQRFHLVYYRGEGRELSRVSPRPRGKDAVVR